MQSKQDKIVATSIATFGVHTVSPESSPLKLIKCMLWTTSINLLSTKLQSRMRLQHDRWLSRIFLLANCKKYFFSLEIGVQITNLIRFLNIHVFYRHLESPHAVVNYQNSVFLCVRLLYSYLTSISEFYMEK